MALEKYRAKRNFTESPEPSGERAHESPPGRTPRFFCVQKHLASHLHYDFRLEHNGVLLSWAVPKGPSLDPATKRLAMAVEDHPIEYGDFEGVIPSGYGAGIVMLWDRGTWTPEVDDVDAALKKGDLKFTLDGLKLKGSWVLVRTKGGGWGSRSSSGGSGDRSWLLIKHRDDWAGAVDIAEFAPLSVKSSGDFADILATGNPDIWLSNRPAQSGEAGAMFERIIERALEMRDARAGTTTAKPAAAKRKPVRKATTTRAATDRRTRGKTTPIRASGSAAPPKTKKKTAARTTGPKRPAR
jgi:bifunctional non-homologous end joining protein LigD